MDQNVLMKVYYGCFQSVLAYVIKNIDFNITIFKVARIVKRNPEMFTNNSEVHCCSARHN